MCFNTICYDHDLNDMESHGSDLGKVLWMIDFALIKKKVS